MLLSKTTLQVIAARDGTSVVTFVLAKNVECALFFFRLEIFHKEIQETKRLCTQIMSI